jgi:hypothetical protein
MRCAISTGLTKQKLLAAVPQRYRVKLPPLRASSYTLLKFRSAREDVVISRVVEAALSRIEGNEQLVAVGGDFTMEGLALLEARGALVVRLGEFGWTDDRYVAIHSKQRAH